MIIDSENRLNNNSEWIQVITTKSNSSHGENYQKIVKTKQKTPIILLKS